MSLQARGVGARFGGVVALADVDLEVEPGKILGVIGPNGSGKSTLFNCITGFVPLASGEVWSDGKELTGQADRRIRTGIARTFQTPRIDGEITVLTSVLCGFLSSVNSALVPSAVGLRRVRRDEREITESARQLIADFGLAHEADTPMGQLSMGQVRMVDVLRAMAMQPRYLLLDEPAAGLSADEQVLLVDGIRRIADRGIGILLVEHNFALVREIADEVVVLQKGEKLVGGPPAEVAKDPRVVDAYLGVGSDHHVDAQAQRTASESSEVVLECQDLHVEYGRARVCSDVSLAVMAGQTTALLGPNGAGKSSLLAALAGVRLDKRRWGGTVTLGGETITAMAADRRPAAGLAFVPEGRGNIFAGMTVEENILLGLRGARADVRERVQSTIMEVFPALPPLLRAKAGLLSGGEQQMVSIAMALASEPTVLMLDEPTQGLAPTILDVLVSAFTDLRSRGIGLLLAEQNQAFAAALADQFVVLSHGEVVSTGTSDELRDRDLIAAAYL